MSPPGRPTCARSVERQWCEGRESILRRIVAVAVDGRNLHGNAHEYAVHYTLRDAP